MNAKQAIDESILRNRTVTLDSATPEDHETLLAWCDGTADVGEVVEYWGTEGADTWRVHARAIEGAR